MEKYVIKGGSVLHGEVEISGAKNAAVAIIPAALMVDGVCRIENLPQISDTDMLLTILSDLGGKVRYINKSTIEIDCTNVHYSDAPYDLMRKIRASYYLIGAMLGRFGTAKTTMPGGCNFGVRPIDQHIKGFEILGSTVTLKENAMIDVEAPDLTGGLVYFDVVSVGATINLMLAAVKAKGLTIIENAAKEPHIVDLANFLNSMGADVRGAGTDVIKIRGVEHMHGCTYSIIPDQIEAGTFMVAAVATQGNVLIKNVIPKHLESITAKLIQCGATVEEYDDSVRVIGNGRPGKCNIKTMPHPGFPTDMQPQFATMLSIADGTSIVSEGVWDSRFQYVEQLSRMGANISVNGKAATIEGVEYLNGSPVKADDLRAGAAMLIAGLIARGTTSIENIVYIDRGYDNVVGKFRNLGADIVRVSEEDKPKPLEDTQVG